MKKILTMLFTVLTALSVTTYVFAEEEKPTYLSDTWKEVMTI